MREGQIAFPSDWDADRIIAAQRGIDRPEKVTIISLAALTKPSGVH